MKRSILVSLVLSVMFATPVLATNCVLTSGDNTSQIQNCLNQAAQSDHVVYVSSFMISAPINVPEYTTLQGSGAQWGTIVTVNFGNNESHNNGSRAAFIMKLGSTIEGITFLYPDQVRGKALMEHPPTIAVIAGDVTVENCMFLNSYVAVDIVGAHGRCFIRNNRYGPHFRMIVIDQCYDVDEISNNRSNPAIWAGSDNSDLYSWMYENSVGIEASRVDWLWIDNFFDWGVQYGIWLNQSQYGISHGVQIDQSGCDACRYGVYSDIESGARSWNVTITKWDGTAFDPQHHPGGDNGTVFYLAHIEGVDISHSQFWGVRDDGIRLEDCSSVTLQGNKYITNGWNQANNGSAAIHLTGCKTGSIVGNVGTSTAASSGGIVLENCNGIKVHANSINVPGANIIFSGTTNSCTSFDNGCASDESGGGSNNSDSWCGNGFPSPTPISSLIPTSTFTPTPTSKPMPTSIVTITPTPTPRFTPKINPCGGFNQKPCN